MSAATKTWLARLRGAAVALAVVSLVAVGAASWVEGTDWYRRSSAWRADIVYASLDCSRGEVCRMRRGAHSAGAANGQTYEFRVNAQGFRGADVPTTRVDPRALRVEVFGDSMTFGLGVDDGQTLPDALAARLRAAFPDRPVEVLNFGLPMNYLASNARSYRDYGRAYRPDAVVFTNAFATNPKDINYRAMQIRDSALASRLMGAAWGRRVINEWQRVAMPWYDHREATSRLRALFDVVAADQRAWGLRVLFFDFFDVPADIESWAPPGLAYRHLGPGITDAAYRAGPYSIHGDGHPTPEGHRFFAARVADALVPMLRGDAPPAGAE